MPAVSPFLARRPPGRGEAGGPIIGSPDRTANREEATRIGSRYLCPAPRPLCPASAQTPLSRSGSRPLCPALRPLCPHSLQRPGDFP
jgi:hypothetical protein